VIDASLLTSPDLPLARVLGIPGEAIDAARALARMLAAHGEVERAQRMLEGCLALDPGDLESALALADLALDRGDAAIALHAAERAVRTAGGESRSPAAGLRFARALLLAGRGDEARACLARLAAAGETTAARILQRLPRRAPSPTPGP
jgi:predicted Zn-dependent protease